jgi:hypothetical protein
MVAKSFQNHANPKAVEGKAFRNIPPFPLLKGMLPEPSYLAKVKAIRTSQLEGC